MAYSSTDSIMDGSSRWLHYSLHSLYLFNKSQLLTDALYYTAKHMLLSQTDGELATLLKGYFGDPQISSDSLDLSRLHDEVLATVHSFVKRNLEGILEGNYSIERAHIHANNFKQTLFSSGYYSGKGELSFLKETKSLIYGEVEYESFSRVLLLAVQGMSISADTFTDLGSGCGKAVLIAKAIATFKKLVGVEIVNELYDMSTRVVEAFYNNNFSWQANRRCRRDAYNIQLVNCSFLDTRAFDWSGADVVFLNSTCFSVHLMRRVQALAARRLKRGSRVITFTNEFTDRAHFKIIFKQRLTMSWGLATVYIHEKISPSRREAAGLADDTDDDEDDNYEDDDADDDDNEGDSEEEAYFEDLDYRGDPESDFDPVAWTQHYSRDYYGTNDGEDEVYDDDDDYKEVYDANGIDDDDDEAEEEVDEQFDDDMFASGSKHAALLPVPPRGSKGSPPREQKDSKASPQRDRKGSKEDYDFADDFDDMAADNEDSFFANEDADSRDSRSESSAAPSLKESPDEYSEYVLA